MSYLLKEFLVIFALLISSFFSQRNDLANQSFYTIYIPDEEYMYLEPKEINCSSGELIEQILRSLYNENVLKNLPNVNSVLIDGDYLKLDLSSEFLENFKNQGTAGEYFIMGSVVNSLIDSYKVNYVLITVNDKYIETGHSIFDKYLEKFVK